MTVSLPFNFTLNLIGLSLLSTLLSCSSIQKVLFSDPPLLDLTKSLTKIEDISNFIPHQIRVGSHAVLLHQSRIPLNYPRIGPGANYPLSDVELPHDAVLMKIDTYFPYSKILILRSMTSGWVHDDSLTTIRPNRFSIVLDTKKLKLSQLKIKLNQVKLFLYETRVSYPLEKGRQVFMLQPQSLESLVWVPGTKNLIWIPNYALI